MGFGPSNYSLKIRESIKTPIPKVGIHLGVCGLIPPHFLIVSTYTFLSVCFSHKPKAKIVTHFIH